MTSGDRKEVSSGVNPEAIEEMAKYGITRVPVDYFHYKEYRYTNLDDAIAQAKSGKFKGGTDLVFDLKNKGMGVGKINPVVPKAWITLMNTYKKNIISGKLKVPTAIK